MGPQTVASSPVARPISRAASHASAEESKYSLNLDALPHSNDDASLDVQDEPLDIIDVIRTDDIDGPTDFTQNMEYWMRLKLPNVVEPISLRGHQKLDLEQYVSSEEQLSSSGELTQTPIRDLHDLPSRPPTIDIKGTIAKNRAAAQKINADQDHSLPDAHHQKSSTQISNLDGPYDEESIHSEPTSPTAYQKRQMQPSVEDYEETPTRIRGGRSASSSAIGETLRRRSARPQLRTSSASHIRLQGPEESLTVRSLESALQTLRHELESTKEKSRADMQKLKEDHAAESVNQASVVNVLKEQLLQEQARSMKQAQQNAALSLQNENLETDFRESRNELEELRNRMASIHRTRQEQLSAKDQEYSTTMRKLKEGHEREISELKGQMKLATSQEFTARTAELEQALAKSKQEVSTRDQQIDQLQMRLADRENSLHLAQQRAEEAETILEETGQLQREEMKHEQQLHDMQISALEERGDSLNNALNQARDEMAALKRKLQAAEQASHQSHQNLKHLEEIREELKERETALETQNAITRSKLTRLEEALKQAELKVASCAAQYAADLERFKAEHAQEKDEMQSLAELAILKIKNLVNKERKEVKRLREELLRVTTATSCEHEEVEDLRNELRITNDRIDDVERDREALRSKLRESQKAAKEAGERAKYAESELDWMTSELESIEENQRAINEKVNQKLLEVVQSKEKQWKLRLAEMESDRQRRGKLLMLQWGQNELGPADPQGYKYKYLLRQALRN